MGLSRKEFVRECVELCNAFQSLNQDDIEESPKTEDDGESIVQSTAVPMQWELMGDPTKTGNLRGVYLYHPPMRLKALDPQLCQRTATETATLEEEVLVDPDMVVTLVQNNEQFRYWQLSVVYSDTWRVPVLYFQVCQLNGAPCSREEVLRLVKATEIKDTWDFLSYEEHPETGEPSFFLHPCQTSARMEIAYLKTDANDDEKDIPKLLFWMSMMLPSIGFRVPAKLYLQLGKLVQLTRRQEG